MLYFYKKFIRASMLLVVFGTATKAVALEISKGVTPSPRGVLADKTAPSENIGKQYVVRKNGQATEVFRAKTEPKKTVSAVPQFAPGLPRWPRTIGPFSTVRNLSILFSRRKADDLYPVYGDARAIRVKNFTRAWI